MLKNISKATAAVLFLAVVTCNAFAYDNGDFQIWNTNEESVRIGKGTKFVMEEEFRYGESASELFYQHYDWGIAYAFDKLLELAFGYRLVLERVKHKWMESDEPYVNIIPKFDIWKFKVEDRNRIEYKHVRFAPDQARYRNRLTIKYPFEFKGITVAPYVSDEIFISSNSTGLHQNRFQPGVEFGLTKYVKADIAYMMQSLKGLNDKWYEANVLWMKLKIAF